MTSALVAKYEEQQRRQRQRTQLLLMQLDEWMWREDANGMVINTITVRHGRDRGEELLVILKVQYEGKPYVGFHSAETAEKAIAGALDRVRANTMKFKEDEPYQPPSGA